MAPATETDFWVDVESSETLEEKLCEKGIKGKAVQEKLSPV